MSLQGYLCFTGSDGKDMPQPQSLVITCFLSEGDVGAAMSGLAGPPSPLLFLLLQEQGRG